MTKDPYRDFKAIEDQPPEWRGNPLLRRMEKHCSDSFPYVCTGRKFVEGTDVRCECGACIKV